MKSFNLPIYVENFDKINSEITRDAVVYSYMFATDVITPEVDENGDVSFLIFDAETEAVKEYINIMMKCANESICTTVLNLSLIEVKPNVYIIK